MTHTNPQVIAEPGGTAVTVGGWACAASPDGRILYLRQVGEFTQLMLLDMLSKREQQLTTSLSRKYEATWSPDGRWVAFATTSSGGINIRRIPAAGGEEQPLTDGVERIRHFFYSVDGRWLYIQPNHRNIYRMPQTAGRVSRSRDSLRRRAFSSKSRRSLPTGVTLSTAATTVDPRSGCSP